MANRAYLVLTGLFFAIVALGHLARAFAHWAVLVGPVSVPEWASWAAFVFTGALALWAFWLAMPHQRARAA